MLQQHQDTETSPETLSQDTEILEVVSEQKAC